MDLLRSTRNTAISYQLLSVDMKKAADSKFQKLRLHLFPDKAKGHDLEKTMSFVAVLFNFSQHQTLAHAQKH